MTQQKDFKRRVRERMQKTSESYTTARKQLLAQRERTVDPRPGLLDGYTLFGGVHGDTAVLRNAFAQAGVTSPHDGRPYSEAMLYGLCGGIGFMYFVFEYDCEPPMLTITLRSFSLPGVFTQGAFDRTGVGVTRSETGSAKVARKALDDALGRGRAAICTVDAVSLPYYGLPAKWAGTSPQLVGVAGIDGGAAWIDDRRGEPNRLSLEQLARARGAYRKAKHRLVAVDPPIAAPDLAAGVRDAIRATARGFHEAPFKGYASNFGFKGVDKWRALLDDPKDRKGWRRVFAEPAHAARALARVYECVRYEYTGPDGGRPFYAEFLREASGVTGVDFGEVAAAFDRAGELWRDVAETAAAADDPALERIRAIVDERARLLREKGSDAADRMRALYEEREAVVEEASLSSEHAIEVFDVLAERVGEIADVERAAVGRMAELAG